MNRIYRFIWVVLLSGALSFAAAQTAVPPLRAPVMDEAQMMSTGYRQKLNQELQDYSRQSGSQIVVLTVATIAPETPFDYGTRVFDQWKIGRKGLDDGVLLLIVRDERKTQLLVGRGLEGAIPDAYAKRILDHEVRPRFRDGDVDGGIAAAVSRLRQLIAGESLPTADGSTDHPSSLSILAIFFAMFFAPLVGRLFQAIFGKVLGSVFVGGVIGGAALWLGVPLFGALWIAVLSFVVSLLTAMSGFGSGGGHYGGGSGSLGGGGGFSGGGFSSGGFSGGGGGVGGGGASGGW